MLNLSKKNSTLSIVIICLYVFALTMNFSIITFGNKIPLIMQIEKYLVHKSGGTTSNKLDDITFRYSLTDIPMGREYYLCAYGISGDTQLSYSSLVFESLSPDVFYMSRNNNVSYVKSYHFDDEEPHYGKLKITSKMDTSFEKIVDLEFVKYYESKLNISINRYVSTLKGYQNGFNLCVDCPVYFNFTFNSKTTERDIEVIYNSEEIEMVSLNKFIPLKECQTKVTFKYYDLFEKTYTFKINRETITSFDDVEVYLYPGTTKNSTGNVLKLNTSYVLYPMKEGKIVRIPFEITTSNPKIVSISENNVLKALNNGTVTIHFTSSFGEFDKELTILTKYELPKVAKSSLYNEEENLYTTVIEQNRTIRLNFPNVTYSQECLIEYDSQMLYLEYETTSSSYANLKIRGLKSGNTKVVLKFGENSDNILEINFNLQRKNVIQTLISSEGFFRKLYSHSLFFGALGVVTIFFAYLILSKKKWYLKLIFILFSGLALALIEEGIQALLVYRNGTFRDVFIFDYIPYLVGLLVSIIILTIILLIKLLIHKLLLKHSR